MKEIEIIPLARRKIERRGIPEAWVGDALRNADQVVEGHAVVRLRNSAAQSVAREKLLRVVFEETEDKYIVITAYLTSDIKWYWKDKAP